MKLSELGKYCGIRLDVLPDFLLDHTLLREQNCERLPEHGNRWVQFLQRLSPWDGVTFCLRFLFEPVTGEIEVYFLAKPTDPAQRDLLQRDMEFALVAYGITNNTHDSKTCLRLMTPVEIAGLPIGDQAREALTSKLEGIYSKALGPVPREAAFAAVVQRVSDSLWTGRPALKKLGETFNSMLDQHRGWAQRKKGTSSLTEVAPSQKYMNWLPHMWQGPVGPFLIPFRALAACRSRACLSVYAQPCKAEDWELEWLHLIRRESGQTNSRAGFEDPGAQLVSEYATSIFNRILHNAWLVSVQCVSFDGSQGEARRVAASVQALCSDRPENFDTTREVAPEAQVLCQSEEGHDTAKIFEKASVAHNHLDFPRWTDDPKRPLALQRLDYLADTRAVATVFRLPVSVRGGVPGVNVRQPTPDFIPGPRYKFPDLALGTELPITFTDAGERSVPSIWLGRFESGGNAMIKLKDLAKHALVTGFTGSGKTNTVLFLLHQLWAHGKPFLAIETVKKEYRGLLKVPRFRGKLRVYTLGDETVTPFQMNPFALIPGLRVEAHIRRLLTCFEAALPALPWIPSILGEAIEELYVERYWSLNHTCLERGEYRRFPTMKSLYEKIGSVVGKRDYSDDVAKDVRASTETRIKPLLMGSLGNMFECQVPFPEGLFETPVVLELNDLNVNDKALVMMFLLTFMREYREIHKAPNELLHVTVVEEAHNVMGKVASQNSEVAADTRAMAVEAFSSMLAEVRAMGEGLIIADQSPSKLTPDALRNCNLLIAHQLRDVKDREAVASVMLMTPEQEQFQGKLDTGQAAVFYTGMQRATFVKMPPYVEPTQHSDSQDFAMNCFSGYDNNLTDEEVVTATAQSANHKGRYKAQDECISSDCKVDCPLRQRLVQFAEANVDKVKNYKVDLDSVVVFKDPSAIRIASRALGISTRQIIREAGLEWTLATGLCWFLLITQMHRLNLPPSALKDAFNEIA